MSFFKDLVKIAAPIAGGFLGGPLGAAVGNVVGGAFGARDDAKRASRATASATPYGYSTFSPLGSVMVDPNSRSVNISAAGNPWATMMQGLGATSIANAMTAPGSPYYGAAPELAEAARGFTPENMAALQSEELARLRAASAPEEQRMFQQMEDQLFSRGQMGTSGGGERYRGFYEAQSMADLARQGQAFDTARLRQMDRFNTALQAVGSGQSGQVNQANIGSGAFGNFQGILRDLMQSGNIGLGAATATPASMAQWNAAMQSSASLPSIVEAAGGGQAVWDALKGAWGHFRTPPFNPNAPDVDWRAQLPPPGSFF